MSLNAENEVLNIKMNNVWKMIAKMVLKHVLV